MSFSEKYNEYLEIINRELENMLNTNVTLERRIFDAMNYSLMVGGKRIRPTLTLAFCDLLGGNTEDALILGTAIECIHTYSLIHDDLPCMDDDDLRRGKPTCHKAFDEATAILAGDGLLNFAFERLSDKNLYKNVSTENILKAIKYISTCSGVFGMIGGQVVDLALENSDNVSIDQLKYLDERKTGALIRCSAVAGVIAAGGAESDILKAEKYAECLGLAFQIKDDILDCESDTETLGKPIGSDLENGKSTYVSVLGIDKAKELLKEYTEKAINILTPYGDKAEFLIQLSDYLCNRKK